MKIAISLAVSIAIACAQGLHAQDLGQAFDDISGAARRMGQSLQTRQGQQDNTRAARAPEVHHAPALVHGPDNGQGAGDESSFRAGPEDRCGSDQHLCGAATAVRCQMSDGDTSWRYHDASTWGTYEYGSVDKWFGGSFVVIANKDTRTDVSINCVTHASLNNRGRHYCAVTKTVDNPGAIGVYGRSSVEEPLRYGRRGEVVGGGQRTTDSTNVCNTSPTGWDIKCGVSDFKLDITSQAESEIASWRFTHHKSAALSWSAGVISEVEFTVPRTGLGITAGLKGDAKFGENDPWIREGTCTLTER
ncbi:MAG: hypothetical protein HYZ75_11280 [Elusimicrobia bacterium]|nr:hypothetical protein [Elusimicrobiota bacterium]